MSAQLALINNMPCELTGSIALAMFESKWSATYPRAMEEFAAKYGSEGTVNWYGS
jgi:hypothetical protein